MCLSTAARVIRRKHACLTIDRMPDTLSVLRAPEGRQLQLKVHGCVWSGEFPENSLAAIRECLTAPVARAEIDINLLRDGDFLVTHDTQLDSATTGSGPVRLTTRQDAAQLQCRWHGKVWDERPPLLSEVADLVRTEASPTVLELDAKDVEPWRSEERRVGKEC